MYKTYEVSNASPCGAGGWGIGAAAILGAAAGYWAGRTNNPLAAAPGAYYGMQGIGPCCNSTPYQQGLETGQTLAGIDYTAKSVNGLDNRMEQYFANVNAQFQAVHAQFNNLNLQKIQDLQNQVNALRTQRVVADAACATNMQLVGINDKVSSIITGCGVRSYPGCAPSPCSCVVSNS